MPDWLMQVLTAAAGAVGVYAGIRADLAGLRVRAEMAANSADEAHKRIDKILMRE